MLNIGQKHVDVFLVLFFPPSPPFFFATVLAWSLAFAHAHVSNTSWGVKQNAQTLCICAVPNSTSATQECQFLPLLAIAEALYESGPASLVLDATACAATVAAMLS